MEDSDSKVQMEGKLAPNRAGAEDIDSPKSLGMMELGISIIQEVVKTLPSSPGVYQMLNEQGEALYVGKARSLKKRVPAYTRFAQLPNRLRRMVSETRLMQIVTTHTEVEALLLEINLIKQLMPRYNVLLRDDKSFPHILIARDHEFPQLVKHRGAQKRPGNYFGPFASAGSVNRTLTAMEKAFLLRSCSDSIFKSRTRPCLMFQIKRCSAPCAGKISTEEYASLVEEAFNFLTGNSQNIHDTMVERMNNAAESLDFETAAAYRDRIRALAHISSHQDINVEGVGDADVFAIAEKGGQTCIQVFFYRGGQNFGGRAFFPSQVRDLGPADAMLAFLGQFYSDRSPPSQVFASIMPSEVDLLEQALSLKAKRRVLIKAPSRGRKRRVIEHASSNAEDALGRRLSESATHRRLLDGLAEAFELDGTPDRIEIYDNSHLSGTNPVGGMVVAGPLGFEKNQYRKFNIRSAAGNDDFDMMREVMFRRFKRAQRAEESGEEVIWPDLLLIDGGKGQLSAVKKTLSEIGIDTIPVIGIAKGLERDAGRERFFVEGRDSFLLPPNSPVLHYLQRLRDEAHRYVIGAQRKRRAKAISENPLDDVPGVGVSRKKALLLRFGSAKAVSRAGFDDLQSTPGISVALAQRIYEHFNGG